ncbi:hypothetical protein [Pasteurella sp. PK-2025]|uniref:hypothetical protein n=1 Tax=Pasteurella sp. PK-2025 TaxID=3413133 RepID=UPI003C73E088
MNTVSIWVAENITFELAYSLFVYNPKKSKINCSKFKKLFDIKNTTFFDEEHVYIVDEILNGISIEHLDKILEKYGFIEIYGNLKSKLSKLNIYQINYMVITPDFEYNGTILEVDGIKFIGAFSYEFNDDFLDWLFNE